MATAVALPGFNDLVHLVTPIFPFRNKYHLQSSLHGPKMNKKSMWEVEKFCQRDINSCHLAAARHVKLQVQSLNVNLFFKKPHQLT